MNVNRDEKRLLKSLTNRRTPEEQKQLNRDARHRKTHPVARNRSRVDAERWHEESSFERIRRSSVPRRTNDTPNAPPTAVVHSRAGQDDGRSAWSRGTVVAVHRGLCDVCVHHETLQAATERSLQPAVGDLVEIDLDGGPDGRARVRSLLPRRTVLSRPDPHDPRIERVLAANVDVAVIVVSIRAPSLHPRLIDRFLVAVERGGIQPIVCVNKVDLATSAAERQGIDETLRPYTQLGVRVVLGSAATGLEMDTLRATVAGKTTVLVGHSGVGKSSVLNAIDPRAAQHTGALRASDGRGRHTTTSSRLVSLEDGTRIIDTPGIRAFGLWKMDRDSLRFFFSEIVTTADECRFRDCSHVTEPGCAVRLAVERGTIPRARWETFLRMLETLDLSTSG